jgi:hypothetical protein
VLDVLATRSPQFVDLLHDGTARLVRLDRQGPDHLRCHGQRGGVPTVYPTGKEVDREQRHFLGTMLQKCGFQKALAGFLGQCPINQPDGRFVFGAGG